MLNFARDPAATGGVGSPEVTDLERKVSDVVRVGRVVEADYPNARLRVGIGDPEDENGYIKTGWLPMASGRSDEWNPIKVGEAVSVVSESGEIQNGVVYPGSIYNTDHPAVGDRGDLWRKRFTDGTLMEYDEAAKHFNITGASGAELKMMVGSASLVVKGGEVTITVGGVGLKVTGGGVSMTGGSVTHDGKIIDKTHIHTGVMSGPALTGPPQ